MNENFPVIPTPSDPVMPLRSSLLNTQGVPNPAPPAAMSPEEWMLYIPSVGYVPRPGLPGLFPPEDYAQFLCR